MHCREIRARLEELAGESLSAPPGGEIDRHLATCEGCREALRVMRQTSAWLRLSRETPLQVGPAFWMRLEAALTERQAEPRWFSILGDEYARPLLYALAGLVLVLGLSLALLEPPATAEPSAVLAFDSPPPSTERILPAGKNGQVDREEVMVTLVAEPEWKQ